MVFWRKEKETNKAGAKKRHKLNHRLIRGPARSGDACEHLKQAFDRCGPPLVLKHDGGSIFHEKQVTDLLHRYGVVSLTSPPPVLCTTVGRSGRHETSKTTSERCEGMNRTTPWPAESTRRYTT